MEQVVWTDRNAKAACKNSEAARVTLRGRRAHSLSKLGWHTKEGVIRRKNTNSPKVNGRPSSAKPLPPFLKVGATEPSQPSTIAKETNFTARPALWRATIRPDAKPQLNRPAAHTAMAQTMAAVTAAGAMVAGEFRVEVDGEGAILTVSSFSRGDAHTWSGDAHTWSGYASKEATVTADLRNSGRLRARMHVPVSRERLTSLGRECVSERAVESPVVWEAPAT